jgi:hypothetical protein
MKTYLTFGILLLFSACTLGEPTTNDEQTIEPPSVQEEQKNVFSESCEIDTTQFAVTTMYDGEPAPVRFDETPQAKEYENEFIASIQEGVTAGGKYNITTWSCGEYCFEHALINLETGQILDTILQSHYGASFSSDSTLIVVNSPELLPENATKIPNGVTTAYFEFKEDMNGFSTLEKICETSAKTPEDMVPRTATSEHKTCRTDADCIPLPGCHVNECINREYTSSYNENVPDFCPNWINCSAAYTEEDCLCVHRICTNANLGDKGCNLPTETE